MGAEVINSNLSARTSKLNMLLIDVEYDSSFASLGCHQTSLRNTNIATVIRLNPY